MTTVTASGGQGGRHAVISWSTGVGSEGGDSYYGVGPGQTLMELQGHQRYQLIMAQVVQVVVEILLTNSIVQEVKEKVELLRLGIQEHEKL